MFDCVLSPSLDFLAVEILHEKLEINVAARFTVSVPLCFVRVLNAAYQKLNSLFSYSASIVFAKTEN